MNHNVECPGDAIIVGPVPRIKLEALDQLMLLIQSYWIEDFFSTADTIMRPEVWEAMKSVIAMLPRKDAPGNFGFDISKIENNYDYLERLFFSQGLKHAQGISEVVVDLNATRPCIIHEMHTFKPKKKLMQAEELRLSRLSQVSQSHAKSQRKTSRQKKAE